MLQTLFLAVLFSSLCCAEQTITPGLYSLPSANIGYALFVPTENAGRLIVTLHGSGERAAGYIGNWTTDAAKHHTCVLAVDSLDPNGWGGQDIDRVIMLTRHFKRVLDIKKTLLCGASSGGHFALFLGISDYQDFDAITTFMGVLSSPFAQYTKVQTLQKNRRPIFMVHGDQDKMIPSIYGRQTADFLRNKGYSVTFDLEKGMHHQHYQPANEKILRWFERVK